jgi:hypothetical protein
MTTPQLRPDFYTGRGGKRPAHAAMELYIKIAGQLSAPASRPNRSEYEELEAGHGLTRFDSWER